MSLIFRKAEPCDADALLQYLKLVGQQTDNLSFDKDTFNISTEREAKFIDRFYKSKKDIMLIAIDGERIVGNGVIERNKILRYSHRAELSITVIKEYWGSGVGTRLMQMMLDFAKNSGVEIVYLEVRSDNHRAISLYKKFGFEKIGTYKNFFKIQKDYFDADLMTLNIE